jgi:hypothetical protein
VFTSNVSVPGRNTATIRADAALSIYRLKTLKSKPKPDDTAIAAIVSRIRRLAAMYPEVILPDDALGECAQSL